MDASDFGEDLRSAWQAQGSPLTAELLRREVRRFAWRTRIADFVAVAFKAGFALLWAAFAWASETPLCRIGCASMAVADAYAVSRLVGFSFVRRLPATGGVATLDFYRSELARRLEGQRTLAAWAIWPAAPGVVLAIVGWVLASPEQWKEAAGVAAFWAGAHYAMELQAREVAGKLEKEMALLDDASAPRVA